MSELSEAIAQAPLPTREHLFSKGLIMPFNCTNSGTRKLMFSTNLEQRLALNNPDVPYVSTGYLAGKYFIIYFGFTYLTFNIKTM